MKIVPVYRRWRDSNNSLLFCLVVLKGNVKSQISGFLSNYSVEIVVYLDVHLLDSSADCEVVDYAKIQTKPCASTYSVKFILESYKSDR